MANDTQNTGKTEKSAELIEGRILEEMLPYYLQVWEKTIDVQTHFNDLELRIRNYAITVLAALLTGAGLTLKDNITVTLFGYSIPVATLLLLTALISWLAFYSMDAFWYHRLLLAAVKHGEIIEDKLNHTIPIVSLTNAIGNQLSDGVGLSKEGSKRRINSFYLIVAGTLLIFSLLLVFGKSTKATEPAIAPTNSSNPTTTPNTNNLSNNNFSEAQSNKGINNSEDNHLKTANVNSDS